jgi:hypothetical protein
MNLFEKLQSVRVELQNTKLKKSGKNKFAGFEYFELADFLPTVNVLFEKKKLFSNFSIIDNTAVLTIVDSEKPDDRTDFTMPTATLELKGCNAIQAAGGVNTYCKRYLYLNALEIVEADMFDSTSGKEEKKQKNVTKLFVENKGSVTIDDSDLDIITGLAGVSDTKNLDIYYTQNKSKVKDLDAFIQACKNRKEAIING